MLAVEHHAEHVPEVRRGELDRPPHAPRDTCRRSRITTGIATAKSACAANDADEAERERRASSEIADEHRHADHREEAPGRRARRLPRRLGVADVLVGDDTRRDRDDERVREHADHEHHERRGQLRRGSCRSCGRRVPLIVTLKRSGCAESNTSVSSTCTGTTTIAAYRTSWPNRAAIQRDRGVEDLADSARP